MSGILMKIKTKLILPLEKKRFLKKYVNTFIFKTNNLLFSQNKSPSANPERNLNKVKKKKYSSFLFPIITPYSHLYLPHHKDLDSPVLQRGRTRWARGWVPSRLPWLCQWAFRWAPGSDLRGAGQLFKVMVIIMVVVLVMVIIRW